MFQILLFPPLASSFAPLLCDENFKKFNSWENKLSENKCETRETREGRPLLTVEAEVNGDSKRTNERGPSLVGFFELVVPVH